MPLLQKTRTVIFRVTQAEYERLKAACVEAGVRSLSEYTRSEVLSSLDADSQGLTVPQRFELIDLKLEKLHEILTRLVGLLAASDSAAGSSPSHPSCD